MDKLLEQKQLELKRRISSLGSQVEVKENTKFEETLPSFTLRRSAIKQAQGPLVYLFLNRTGEPLYIGKSINGLWRPFNPMHNAKRARYEAHKAVFVPCKNEAEALNLEAILIHKYKPKFNKKLPSSAMIKAVRKYEAEKVDAALATQKAQYEKFGDFLTPMQVEERQYNKRQAKKELEIAEKQAALIRQFTPDL